MRGLFFFFAVALKAQLLVEDQRFAEAFEPVEGWIQSGQLARAEERLRQVLAMPGSPGLIEFSLHGQLWGQLVDVYISRDDYKNAERILVDLVKEAEARYGSEQMVLVESLANVQLTQGKFGPAEAAFRRCLARPRKVFIGRCDGAYLGLAEVLLATNRAAEAVELLKSVSAYPGESHLNHYAVALREAGQIEEAEAVVKRMDGAVLFPRRVGEQDRDFLRARLFTLRNAPDKAEAIYSKWIAYAEAVGSDLFGPLEFYRVFLRQQARHQEADRVRARVDALRAKDAPQR